MSFSLIFRRKGVQYPKVMMIAAFFQPFHDVESNFALSGPIFKNSSTKKLQTTMLELICQT